MQRGKMGMCCPKLGGGPALPVPPERAWTLLSGLLAWTGSLAGQDLLGDTQVVLQHPSPMWNVE